MQPQITHLLLFSLINLGSSALSGAAGGGGSLIGIPVLVLMGLTPSQAIVVTKFNGLGTAAGTSVRFWHERLTSRRTLLIVSVIGAVASVLGSMVLLRLSRHEHLLEDITAWAILLVGIPLLYTRNLGIETKRRSLLAKVIGGGLLFVGIVFQVAVGAGLGSLQLVVLIACFGMTALTASATRRIMQLTVSAISVGIFVVLGLVDYRYAAVALVTSLLGGYIGAHIAIRKGNKFIMNLFAVTSALLALQLLWR